MPSAKNGKFMNLGIKIMAKILIIGAGGVATVAAHKLAQNADVFTEIMIASRTKKSAMPLRTT